MEDRCRLCSRNREDGSDYCIYHLRAHVKLQEAFERWRRALDINWNEFLREASDNAGTGEWAREVAVDLLQCGLS